MRPLALEGPDIFPRPKLYHLLLSGIQYSRVTMFKLLHALSGHFPHCPLACFSLYLWAIWMSLGSPADKGMYCYFLKLLIQPSIPSSTFAQKSLECWFSDGASWCMYVIKRLNYNILQEFGWDPDVVYLHHGKYSFVKLS